MATTDTRRERIDALGWTPAGHSTEDVSACNLCGSRELVEAARTDRYGFDQRFVVCARCGLGFLAPRLDAKEYADFYTDTYRPLVSAYHGRLIDAETVQDDQRLYTDQLMAFLRNTLPSPPRTVMDVGGSTGIVAEGCIREFGSSATVLDPAPDELAVAASLGMETVEGFAEDFDPRGRRWDLVLLCQTIDHLLDVRLTLSKLRELTADDGHAFIDVLDFEYALNAKGTVEGAVKVDHPYYLTRHTARAFFAQAGYAVAAERMSDDGHWGFLLSAAQPAEPDWSALQQKTEQLLDEIWRRRAQG